MWLVGLLALLVAATAVSSAFGGHAKPRFVWPYGRSQAYVTSCSNLPGGGVSCGCQVAILRTRLAWGDLTGVWKGTDLHASASAKATAHERCGGPDPTAVMRVIALR
ncbi:MAG: hypothetical protein F2796_07090 [Actinobacteria bacterium]|nr:hypothetical protein [Actinomycetota bacterium]